MKSIADPLALKIVEFTKALWIFAEDDPSPGGWTVVDNLCPPKSDLLDCSTGSIAKEVSLEASVTVYFPSNGWRLNLTIQAIGRLVGTWNFYKFNQQQWSRVPPFASRLENGPKPNWPECGPDECPHVVRVSAARGTPHDQVAI
jgi:hypothetical protein